MLLAHVDVLVGVFPVSQAAVAYSITSAQLAAFLTCLFFSCSILNFKSSVCVGGGRVVCLGVVVLVFFVCVCFF